MISFNFFSDRSMTIFFFVDSECEMPAKNSFVRFEWQTAKTEDFNFETISQTLWVEIDCDKRCLLKNLKKFESKISTFWENVQKEKKEWTDVTHFFQTSESNLL